jgi:hypothetical protein
MFGLLFNLSVHDLLSTQKNVGACSSEHAKAAIRHSTQFFAACHPVRAADADELAAAPSKCGTIARKVLSYKDISHRFCTGRKHRDGKNKKKNF